MLAIDSFPVNQGKLFMKRILAPTDDAKTDMTTPANIVILFIFTPNFLFNYNAMHQLRICRSTAVANTSAECNCWARYSPNRSFPASSLSPAGARSYITAETGGMTGSIPDFQKMWSVPQLMPDNFFSLHCWR